MGVPHYPPVLLYFSSKVMSLFSGNFISDLLFPQTSGIPPLPPPPHFQLMASPLISLKKKSQKRNSFIFPPSNLLNHLGLHAIAFPLICSSFSSSPLHHPDSLQTCSGAPILNHLHISFVTYPVSTKLIQQCSTRLYLLPHSISFPCLL